jgi:hypothetical protein
MTGLLGYSDPYILPWFMIAVAVVASAYGLPWGLLAALLSTLVLLLFPGFDLVALALLLLSALLAHGVGESLRRAHRRAKALARSQRLIAEAPRGPPPGPKPGGPPARASPSASLPWGKGGTSGSGCPPRGGLAFSPPTRP